MPNSTNKLLGYPDDARLLIVNADDFGMCHAINEAIFTALKEGIMTSTSLMVPCPWALHATNWLQKNLDVPFAVHLTLISEAPLYCWKPVSSKEDVPSLLDNTGYFYNLEGMKDPLEQAELGEVEREFRAQIEIVLAAGLSPTHLDWHCLSNGGRSDIFELTLALAREYGLAMRVHGSPYREHCQKLNLPSSDYSLLDSYALKTGNKTEQYIERLRQLPAGLSEWAVHPGLGTAELKAVEPDSWRVRETDYEFFTSPAARKIVQEEGIILLDYRAVQAVWNANLEKSSQLFLRTD